MYGYVAHVCMLFKLIMICVYVQAKVAMYVQESSRMCMHFIVDFIACDMRVVLNLSLTCTVSGKPVCACPPLRLLNTHVKMKLY